MTAVVEVVGVDPRDTGVAPAAAKAIRETYARTGGSGMAPVVVEDAKDPSSPLHRYFEWDDTAAAQAYRIEQAEALIRRVRVWVLPSEPDSKPIAVRAYVASRDLREAAEDLGDTEVSESPAGSYLALEEVAGQTAYEAALLDTIRTDFERLARKHRAHSDVFRSVAGAFFGAGE
jgi:hypothetical protein